MQQTHACIVGGGLVGSLLSVILAKKGLQIDLWERRPDIRTGKAEGGRSINLALSNRGLRALALAGLEKEVKELCIPMYGRQVHHEGGETFMRYGKEGECINSISRGGLNQLLLLHADKHKNIEMHFDQRCDDIHFPTGEAAFRHTQTNELTKKKYDVVFGTDGAFSAARLALMRTDRLDFQYRQDYLKHSYKELSMPAAEGGGWRLEKNALHIWPRKSFMLIALPNLDGSFTCTLFLSHEGEVSFEKLITENDVRQFFEKYFPDALPNMPTLMEDFFGNPTASLATVRCQPWHYDGKGTLLGDAAHAIVPFYGQGMNAGFEDCHVLHNLVEEHGDDWATIFPRFFELRKPNGDAVADLALRNFVEMRDLVADPEFILKNKIDYKLGELFPDKWMPLYRMVTFSELSYHEALTKGQEHDRVLEKIVSEQPGIGERLGEEGVKGELEGYLI